jgi:hypothetical protein
VPDEVPEEVALVWASTFSGNVMISVQTHTKYKKTVATQNFDVFMGLVISQQAKERNTTSSLGYF